MARRHYFIRIFSSLAALPVRHPHRTPSPHKHKIHIRPKLSGKFGVKNLAVVIINFTFAMLYRQAPATPVPPQPLSTLIFKDKHPMIFNFRIVSDEVDNFKREIKIDADASFLDLKNAICDSVDYDKNEMCSFFICSDNWEKEKEITLEDMGSDSSEDVYLMEDTLLSDLIDDEGQRLLFTFDYMTDRSFYMEMKELVPGKNLKDPVCSLALGKAPAQSVDLDEFEAKTDAKAKAAAVSAADDIDEDFYGSESFNDDEFDMEGFDEMTFDQ